MGKIFIALASLVVVAAVSNPATAYILELVSQTATQSGTGTHWDATGGGGTGPGTYRVGSVSAESYEYSYYDPDTGQYEAGVRSGQVWGTYTWRLLSEHGNTGVVSLGLHNTGDGWSQGAWAQAEIHVTSSADSWGKQYQWYDFYSWDLTPSFLVPIGETVTVALYAYASGGPWGGASVTADFVLPEEPVPDPCTLLLFGAGTLITIARRGRSGR